MGFLLGVITDQRAPWLKARRISRLPREAYHRPDDSRFEQESPTGNFP
jgi:hypothetical protein